MRVDASSRRRGDKGLRTDQERFHSLFENANDVIFTLDLNERLTSVNRRGLEITGYTKREILAKSLPDILAPEFAEEVHRALHKMTSGNGGEGSRILEVEILNRDGERLPFEVSIQTVAGGGRPVEILAIARDIRERRRFEERLHQAQRMEVVGHLAGGIAHDFNNLLTGIAGFAQLALEAIPEKSPAQSYLLEICRMSERAATLTGQLLTFSRRGRLRTAPSNLNAIAESTLKLLERLLESNIKLVFSPAPELWNVQADPSHMDQVLLNLILNARDAMPSGGTVTIETRNVKIPEGPHKPRPELDLKPGCYVSLVVTDTGYGMDRSTLERIYEPFFTTKKTGRGTGLGLSVVYGIIQQHDGHIHVESIPGKGTIFEILLPRSENAEPGQVFKTSADLVPRGSETILVIDDEEPLRILIERALGELGYKVRTAGNCGEAMERFMPERLKFHLVITDAVLPGTGFRRVFKYLKKESPSIKVLYISGYGDHPPRTRLGRATFLAKPFSPATLARKVRELLDSQR